MSVVQNRVIDKEKRSKILVVGHTVIDTVIDFKGSGSRTALGGPISYASIALASLGKNYAVVTKVGSDFPTEYANVLSRYAKINAVEFTVDGYKTTRFRIDRSVSPRKMWLLSKCRSIEKNDIAPFLERSSAAHPTALVIDSVAGEVSFSLLERISKEFEEVFVDSQGFVRQFSSSNGEVSMKSSTDISSLSGVDFLKADRTELSSWTGIKDIHSSINQISRFVGNLILTANGGRLDFFEGGSLRMRAKPLDVVVKDSTGAGDIMLSVFAAALTETQDIKKSLCTAVAASGLAIRNLGVEKAILNKEEVESASEKVEILEY